MSNNTITINISGPEGVDTTTISFLLGEFLVHTGLDVSINLLDGVDEEEATANFEEKLEAISDHETKIIINEVFP